jgi:enamine deaminase RidA (YjgF/YER057c/UK114 family)
VGLGPPTPFGKTAFMPSTPPAVPGSLHFREGGTYEEQAGYARAVRRGPCIAVSGTTCRAPAAGRDTRAQALDCLGRVVAAVERLGGGRADIIRTRVYLAPGADWAAASDAHREVLGEVAPANTMLFVHGLIGGDELVEVEAEAYVPGPDPA